jgi:hypothetical protein
LMRIWLSNGSVQGRAGDIVVCVEATAASVADVVDDEVSASDVDLGVDETVAEDVDRGACVVPAVEEAP